MKSKVFRLAALVVCLVLLGTVSFADNSKKAPPSKPTEVKEKPKETDKKEQPNPAAITPAQVSPKQDQPTPVIKPAEPQPIRPILAPAAHRAGGQIKWKVVSSGGRDAGSSSYKLGGTVVQVAVGWGSSVSYGLNPGFWQEFVEEEFLRGDVNADGIIDLGDVLYLISYLYKGGIPPDPLESGECDCNGIIDLGDLLFLISYLYKGGPAPDC